MRLSFAGLGDLLRDVAVEALPRLPTPQRRALEGALLLAEPLEAPDPRAVGVAVVETLRSLAITGRVVLAIDDLQWMDVPSGELLAFALRRLDGAAVRLLATVRSGTSSAVPFELDRALGDEHVRQLALGPLSLGALHELVRTRLGVTLPRATLVRVTRRPQETRCSLSSWSGSCIGAGWNSAPGPPPAPGRCQGAVRERLARLPGRTRGLLRAAAAHPGPTVTLLEEAIGDADTAAADLERSLQAGVIELEGEHVRFTHPLLASLCYTDASPLQRRRVHARFAIIVDDPEARARHVALAADSEDEDVARSLEEAAERAVGRGATQAAAELWELATAFTPPERADEHRRRRRATAESRLQAGDLAGAVALLQQLVNETSAGADRAELLLLLAMAREDDLVESIKLCEEVIELAVGDHRLQSRAHQGLAAQLCVQGDIRTALAHLRHAAALAERAGDDELLTAALGPAIDLEFWSGDVTPGLLDRALELEMRVSGLPSYDSPSAAAGRWLMCLDRYDEARGLLERELGRATATGDEPGKGGLLLHLTELECRSGNWRRADELAAECHELYERRGLEFQGALPMYARALVDAHLGRTEQCRAAAQKGVAIARDAGDWVFEIQNLGVVGFLELSLGNLEAAAGHLRDLPARLVTLGWNEPTIYPVWPNAIEALIGLGELEQASVYVDAVRGASRASGSPWALATSNRCRGLLSGRRRPPR